MAVIEIQEKDFKEATKEGLNLIYFTAPWCGPCKMLGPAIEELAVEQKDELNIRKIDVDKEPKLAGRLGIMSVPALLLYKDGELVDQRFGFAPKEILSEWIDTHK